MNVSEGEHADGDAIVHLAPVGAMPETGGLR
jgi:hypothetical protein